MEKLLFRFCACFTHFLSLSSSFFTASRDETLEALSDAQVVAPAAQTVDLHSADHRNSYLYVFDYQTRFGDYPQVNNRVDLPLQQHHFWPSVINMNWPNWPRLHSHYSHSDRAAFTARTCPTSLVRLWSVVSITLLATIPKPKSVSLRSLCTTGLTLCAPGKCCCCCCNCWLGLRSAAEPCDECTHAAIHAFACSNPNEQMETEHGSRQERSRYKTIEWTAYESVHKKYLNFGE